MVIRIPSISRTIAELRKIFVRFGSPEIVVSDNGPQFAFQNFCLQQVIAHLRCPLYHTQSNNQAECFADALKCLLRRLREGETEEILQVFFVQISNNIKLSRSNGKSLAEVMFQRRIKPHEIVRPASDCEPKHYGATIQPHREFSKSDKLCWFEFIESVLDRSSVIAVTSST